MRNLVGGFELQKSQCGPDRGLDRAAFRLKVQQPTQRLECALAQPGPLGSQPLLEHRLIEAETRQQVSPVERVRMLERTPASIDHATLEGDDVDLDRGRIESQGLALDPQDRRPAAGKSVPKGSQRVAKTVPRLLVALLPHKSAASLSRR